MAEIQIIAKDDHQVLANISGAGAKLQESSVVLLKVSPEDVLVIQRDGINIVIQLKNGEVITIKNFFAENTVTDNSLVLGDGSNGLTWARMTDNEGVLLEQVKYQSLDNIDALLYSGESSNLLYWAALPVAIGTGMIIHHNNKKDSSEPELDHTKPTDPTNLSVSGDGKNVKGKGEAGALVIVRDSNGKVIGSGTVNSKGDFDIKLDKPLTNGEKLKISIQDAAGNISGEVTITAPDTTKPNDPTAIKVELDGSKVSGKGEPGAEVIIKDKNGKELGKAKVNDKGEFEVKFDPALSAGQDIKVSIKDPSGNESGSVAAKVAPNQPTINHFDGHELSGTADAGTVIKVFVDGRLVGTIMVNSNGQYSLKLKEALKNGESIIVKAYDEYENASKGSEGWAPDTTAPIAPDVIFDGKVVQGKTEAGAKVIVKTPTGEEKTVFAGTDGSFKVTLDTPVNLGESIDVTATDKAGNTSEVSKVVAVKPSAEPDQPKEVLSDTDTEQSNAEIAQKSVQNLSQPLDMLAQDLATENDLFDVLGVSDKLAAQLPLSDLQGDDQVDITSLLEEVQTKEFDDKFNDLSQLAIIQSQSSDTNISDLALKAERLIIKDSFKPFDELSQFEELQF